MAHALIKKSKFQPAIEKPLADPHVLANRWLERAEDVSGPDGDIFDQFVCAWIAFNALYGRSDSHDVRAVERDMIRVFLGKVMKERPKLVELLTAPDAHVFVANPVYNASRRREHIDEDREALANLKESSKKRLNSLFMILYTVRCNLFHGQKSPDSRRDVEVVRAAANLVTAAVRTILSPNLSILRSRDAVP